MDAETNFRFKARAKHDWLGRARDIVAMRRVAAQYGEDKNILAQQGEAAGLLRAEAYDLLDFCIGEASRFDTVEVMDNLRDYHEMLKILDGEAD